MHTIEIRVLKIISMYSKLNYSIRWYYSLYENKDMVWLTFYVAGIGLKGLNRVIV